MGKSILFLRPWLPRFSHLFVVTFPNFVAHEDVYWHSYDPFFPFYTHHITWRRRRWIDKNGTTQEHTFQFEFRIAIRRRRSFRGAISRNSWQSVKPILLTLVNRRQLAETGKAEIWPFLHSENLLNKLGHSL